MDTNQLAKSVFVAEFLNLPTAVGLRGMLLTYLPSSLKAEEAVKKAGETISLSEFLSSKHKGNALMNTKEAWVSFPRILSFFQDKGYVLRAADFPAEALSSAVKNNALSKIFDPVNWRGNFEEAEKLYFQIPSGHRMSHMTMDDFVKFKRSVYELEGRITREDQLKSYGIDWRTIPDVFEKITGAKDIQKLAAKLRRNGDYLRKEDVFLTDKDGNNMMFHERAWTSFDIIVSLVHQSGDRFEVKDFLKKVGNRRSLIGRADEARALDKIFTEKVWGDRLPEMISLYRSLKPVQRLDLDEDAFLQALQKAEDNLYGGLIDYKAAKLKDILKPVAILGNVRFYPLGLASTWEEWDQYSDLLLNADSFDFDLLKTRSGYMDKTLFETALDSAHLDKVVTLLAHHNVAPPVEFLLKKDEMGQSLLTKIAARKQLDVLFTPDMWVGHEKEIKKLWASVPITEKAQVNWTRVLNEVNVMSFQKKAKKNTKPPVRKRPNLK